MYVLNILLSSPPEAETVFLHCCLLNYRKIVPSGIDSNRILEKLPKPKVSKVPPKKSDVC
jgi:hypothetical protein